MKTTYTTVGDIRGWCGHAHRSIRTAAACLERDRRGCARQGGYSDRRVVARDPGHRANDHTSPPDIFVLNKPAGLIHGARALYEDEGARPWESSDS